MIESTTGTHAEMPYGEGRGSLQFQLGLCTFGILALELAVIRWTSGQIRIVAYFSNLILLAAFLGMGLGVPLGRRYPQLIHACLPALAVFSAVLAFSDPLKLMHIPFPDPTVSLWGGESSISGWGFAGVTLLLVVLFWYIAGIFILASAPLGCLFDRMQPLKAYSADLLGSLLGVIAMTAVAAFGTSPAVWMGLACVPCLWFSRRTTSFASALAVIAFAAYSINGAQFSPYNRIDLEPFVLPNTPPNEAVKPEWVLSVNRDYHQHIVDFSDAAVEAQPKMRRTMRDIYTLPFQFAAKGGRALIVGAGTGNDVMAALRSGMNQVVSVDIDGRIIDLGRKLHPEQPYSDPRVVPVVNDARAYFEQNPDEHFDVVCYGLLDSHAMFSTMSTLRLDNFVYTEEGIRAGWSHVKEDGVLSVCFSVFAGPWMMQRMAGIIHNATGLDPIVIKHGMNFGATFLVGRHLDAAHIPQTFSRFLTDVNVDPNIRIPTDNWPFLYMRPDAVPYGYISVLSLVLLTAVFAVRKVYGASMFTAQHFNVPLFLMGAAFMLLETRMVTELSLLFGSTWIVNSSVFAGILLMVLTANFTVARFQFQKILIWFVPLAASLLVTWAVGAGILNKLPLLERGIVGGVLFALPVAFAGVIFSGLLKRSTDPTGALGSNLLGAVVGGVLEYSTMYFGLKAMALVALAFYIAALLYLLKHPVHLQSAEN